MLALGAVHQHLVAEGTRLQTSLVVETGEAREIHHIAALIGYGAAAVNPYLLFESLTDLHGRAELPDDLSHEEATERLLPAIRKGLLKVMSKMGIATIQSYCGAQIFEAVGLDRELVDRYFGGTPSAVGGVGLARARRRGARTPRSRLPRAPRPQPARARRGLAAARGAREAAAPGRRVRLAARRRAPRLGPGDDRRAAARGARESAPQQRRGRLRLRRRHRGARALRGVPRRASTRRTARWRCSAGCSR